MIERTRDKIAASRRKGKWTGGPVPFGYSVKDKKLLVNEVEAQIVREAFTLFLQHRQMAMVARLFQSRHYIAERTLADGRVIPTVWPALIDRATFERAQLLLAKNSDTKPSGREKTKYTLLLEGLLRCGKCGGAMTYSAANGRSKTYHYYECVQRVNHGDGACNVKPLSAPAVEGFILDRLRGFSVDDKTLRDSVSTTNAGRDADLARLESEIASHRRALAANATDAKKFVPSTVVDQLRSLELCRKEIDLTLIELDAKRAAIADSVLEVEQVADAFKNFAVLFDAAEKAGAREELRYLLRSIVDVIEWREDANDPKKGEALVLLFAPLNGLVPPDGRETTTPEMKQPNDGSLGCATWLRHLDSNQGPCD